MSRKLWLRLAGWTVSIACLSFFVTKAAPLLRDGRVTSLVDQLNWPPVAAATIAFLMAYLAFAMVWQRLLVGLGTNISVSLATGVFATAQFGKYLPGNVGQHVGRLTLSTRYGLAPATVASTMFLEIGLVLALSFVMGLPVFPALLKWAGVPTELSPALALILVSAALILASIALAIYRRAPRLHDILSRQFSTARLHGPRFAKCLLAAALLAALGLILSGASFALLDPTGRLTSPHIFPTTLAVFCASWAIGFLTPGAPAGLGIREVSLTQGLTPILGLEGAVAVALLFRILSTLSDLLVFGIGLYMLRFGKRSTLIQARS